MPQFDSFVDCGYMVSMVMDDDGENQNQWLIIPIELNDYIFLGLKNHHCSIMIIVLNDNENIFFVVDF